MCCALISKRGGRGSRGLCRKSHALEHIHFSRLAQHRVLAVVVTKSGAVLDRVLMLDRDLTHAELTASARFLERELSQLVD